MTTETPTINYKIGNERLISVTESAARKLASLLEEKGQPEGALRLKVIGGGCSGLQYVMDLVDGPIGARHPCSDAKRATSLSIQKARYSLAAPCSITAKTCKRAASK